MGPAVLVMLWESGVEAALSRKTSLQQPEIV